MAYSAEPELSIHGAGDFLLRPFHGEAQLAPIYIRDGTLGANGERLHFTSTQPFHREDFKTRKVL
jgi:hypothetical protein